MRAYYTEDIYSHSYTLHCKLPPRKFDAAVETARSRMRPKSNVHGFRDRATMHHDHIYIVSALPRHVVISGLEEITAEINKL